MTSAPRLSDVRNAGLYPCVYNWPGMMPAMFLLPAALIPLAEVSDKVGHPLTMWIFMLVPALFVLILSLQGRWVLLVTVPLSLCWAIIATCSMLADDPLRDAVLRELGWSYILNEIAACWLPLLATIGAAWVHWRRTNEQRSKGFPVLQIDTKHLGKPHGS